jgi:putative hydrolase of the HAD superfamily
VTGTAEPGVVGVLFDVDDTLVDTKGAFGHALHAVMNEYLPGVEAARRAEVLDHWRRDPTGYYRAYARGEIGYQAQRMARANELLAVFGGPELDDEGYASWNALFETGFRSGWRAHLDAAPAVRALRGAGHLLGALSNASVDYQAIKLEAVGLAADVPMLVGVDTLGVGKPDPRVFVEACRRLGTAPGRTVYVGDELDIDAQAASAAGLLGVWLDRPGARRIEVSAEEIGAAGVAIISSLSELLALVGEIARR